MTDNNIQPSSQAKVTKKLGQLEFIALMAALMALPALAIDAMLPALLNIGEDLHAAEGNAVQLIISLIFIGIALGQLLFGPLADTLGRKRSMLIGTSIFLLGSLITIFADNFNLLLAGRVIQGVGLGAPRTITIAIVRDQYAGRQMAKVMSNIMSVFMLVPMVAPMIGQIVLFAGGNWRGIFVLIFTLGIIVTFWFSLRQPETLQPENRTKFSFYNFCGSIAYVCKQPVVMLYALASGFLFSSFIAYLSSSAHIFQHQYNTGPWFVVIFTITALSISAATQLNSRWVVRLGMQKISYIAISVVISSSLLFIIYVLITGQKPPLYIFLIYLIFVMFGQGGLFGNLNALAMEPLDKNTGTGAMVTGIFSTLVAVPLGTLLASQILDSTLPLAVGFCLFATLILLVILFTEYRVKKNA